MSNFEYLRDRDIQVTNLEIQALKVRSELNGVIKILFDTQAAVARKIIDEPEFKEIGQPYDSPLWLLNTKQYPTGEFRFDGIKWYQDCAYRDGDYALEIQLLPEFLDGTPEQKEEAVRNFYRAYFEKKNEEKATAARRRIDAARAVLEAAGITV